MMRAAIGFFSGEEYLQIPDIPPNPPPRDPPPLPLDFRAPTLVVKMTSSEDEENEESS